jgi:hypothetical protein
MNPGGFFNSSKPFLTRHGARLFLPMVPVYSIWKEVGLCDTSSACLFGMTFGAPNAMAANNKARKKHQNRENSQEKRSLRPKPATNDRHVTLRGTWFLLKRTFHHLFFQTEIFDTMAMGAL